MISVTYNVFEGCELLRSSLRQVRPIADYINVVFQTESYFGNPVDEKDREHVESCRDLYDELIVYEPENIAKEYNTSNIKKAKAEEAKKRQQGLEAAQKAGADYWTNFDVDEFFKTKELEAAAKKVIEEGITHSGCKIVDYKRLPTFRLDGLEEGGDIKAPLFFEVTNNSRISYLRKQSARDAIGAFRTDPTRMVRTPNLESNHYVFSQDEIVMHHMKTVRENLRKKFENTSRSTHSLDRSNLKKKINRINSYHPNENGNGRVVKDIFSIGTEQFK